MVDRTDEFINIVPGLCKAQPAGQTLFVAKASSLLSSICQMHDIAVNSFSNYVGYHSHISSYRATLMSEADRSIFDENFLLFIATCASKVHDV